MSKKRFALVIAILGLFFAWVEYRNHAVVRSLDAQLASLNKPVVIHPRPEDETKVALARVQAAFDSETGQPAWSGADENSLRELVEGWIGGMSVHGHGFVCRRTLCRVVATFADREALRQFMSRLGRNFRTGWKGPMLTGVQDENQPGVAWVGFFGKQGTRFP